MTPNVFFLSGVIPGTPAFLPFLNLGVNRVILPGSDDGTSQPIALPDYGFPFWNSSRTVVYVRLVLNIKACNKNIFF